MKRHKSLLVALFLLGFIESTFSQSSIDTFLTPSDTLNVKRRNAVILSESALAGGALIGLSQLWYADYPKSDFHFINDNEDWLQMDKVGHFFSAYQLGNFGKHALQWSGVSKKDQLIYGATIGFGFLTVVEVFDGYSAEWGASSGDIIANASGTALFVSQELLWKEQRIVPKFSFHKTYYANLRPEALGSSLNEQIIKDYNGQTYWLSFNLHSFYKDSKIPKWLNVAVGYGATGMVSGNDETLTPGIPDIKRARQYYLSVDVDLTKIKTKSPLLKTVFSVFNSIKIPAPTMEFTGSHHVQGYLFYF
ncbi:MAG: DUF2279 domain-containing protein [Bacteroidota bacterium]